VFEKLKALEPDFAMVPSQEDIGKMEPPVVYSPEMVPCVYAFFHLVFSFSIPALAANLVSIRDRAALQATAPAFKQEFGVNVHVTVPRTVSLHPLRESPTEAI
jgi:hypothetical protein